MIKIMNLMPEIMNRSTAVSFLDEPVPEEVLTDILEAGRLAPSAKNRQPWRFIVIRDVQMKENLQKCAYGDDRFKQAPFIIAACTTNIGYKMPNGEVSYPIDLSFAVSQMMIQASFSGLGSSVITTFRQEDVKNLLTVPYSMKVIMFLLVGKTEEKADREGRLPLERVVSFDHW